MSCFPTAKTYLSLHADNEKLIKQSSSISTVSFGAPRELECVLTGEKAVGRHSDLPADRVLPATDRTMNVMKPGAQSAMKHRVPKTSHIFSRRDEEYVFGGPNIRYSVSFRATNESAVADAGAQDLPTKPKPPVSPVTGQNTARHVPPRKKNIVLIAGGSMPNRLDADRLAGTRKKQSVINIAKGGSTIPQVERDIISFVENNPDYAITKLIISVGTNDVRYCRSKEDCKAVKPTLKVLMQRVKALLPDCKIWFQSLLPIVDGREFTTRNVCEMNSILFELCVKNGMYFIDAFNPFFDVRGNRNDRLFKELDPKKPDIHPNSRGLGVLARCYIFVIRNNKFNPFGY